MHIIVNFKNKKEYSTRDTVSIQVTYAWPVIEYAKIIPNNQELDVTVVNLNSTDRFKFAQTYSSKPGTKLNNP